MIPIASRQHQTDEVIFVARGKRQKQQELGAILLGKSCDYISRTDELRCFALTRDKSRQVPDVFLVVKGLWIKHVVRSVDLRLNAKKDLRVPSMPSQVGGHSGGGLEEAGKELLVSQDDRIVRREDV